MRRRRERPNGRSGAAVRDGIGIGNGDGERGPGSAPRSAGVRGPGPARGTPPVPPPVRGAAAGAGGALAERGGKAVSCGEPRNKGLEWSKVGGHGEGDPRRARWPGRCCWPGLR